MATAKLNLELLERELDATSEEIVDRLWELGFEPELTDEGLEIDVTPDRPDLFSTYGVLRMLKGFFGKARKELQTYPSDYEVIVDNVPIRPEAVFLVAKGVKIGEEELEDIIQLQEKIHSTFGRKRRKASIGFYRLNEISFPVRYTALRPEEIRFTPLDFEEEMNALEILEKHPKGIEYGDIIRASKKFPALIDANGRFLSLPPIINAEGVGRVTPGTSDVFVDVTGTCSRTVRKVLEIISMVLQEMGGTVYRVRLQPSGEEQPLSRFEEWKLHKKTVEQVMGISLTPDEIAKYLELMDHKVVTTGETFKVLVPPYRVDVLHEVDLADDVLRAHGINSLEPKLPRVFSVGGLLPETQLAEEISELLVGFGFVEVFTFALSTKERQFKKMRLSGRAVELEDVKSGVNVLRTLLLPELLETIRLNKTEKKPLNIFEVSYVVSPDEPFRNRLHVSAIIYHSKASFTEIRQVLDFLLKYLGLNFKYVEKEHPSFLPGRTAAVVVGKKEIGLVGEIHPEVLENFELDLPAAAFEVDISEVLAWIRR